MKPKTLKCKRKWAVRSAEYYDWIKAVDSELTRQDRLLARGLPALSRLTGWWYFPQGYTGDLQPW